MIEAIILSSLTWLVCAVTVAFLVPVLLNWDLRPNCLFDVVAEITSSSIYLNEGNKKS